MGKIGGWFHKAWLVLLVAGIVIVLDQWTKGLVRLHIPKFDYVIPIPALGEYFVFEHVDNYGAAFGILQNQGNFFIIVAIVVIIAILYFVRHLPTDQWIVRVLLGLMLGGAIGNVIDRFQQGYVTDFIKAGIPGVYYWPNFNIADAAIVVGVVGLGIYVLVDDFRQRRHQKALAASDAGDLPVGGSPQSDAHD